MGLFRGQDLPLQCFVHKMGLFVDKIFLYSVSSTKWGFFVDGAMVFGTIPGSNGVFSD